MCLDLDRYQARLQQRVHLTRCIVAADELIDELQGLALVGQPVVPDAWQARLDSFADGLPPGVAGELRAGTEPAHFLDHLFEIEERLLRLKLGEWALAFAAPAAVRSPSRLPSRRPAAERAR